MVNNLAFLAWVLLCFLRGARGVGWLSRWLLHSSSLGALFISDYNWCGEMAHEDIYTQSNKINIYIYLIKNIHYSTARMTI